MARILVAEDEPDIRELIELILTGAGHAVVTAADGFEAVSLYRPGDFELVLLDLDMPRLNGTGVTRAIRAGMVDDIPILMITASATPGDIDEAHEAGISAVIGKPFLATDLRLEVTRLLNNSQTARQPTN